MSEYRERTEELAKGIMAPIIENYRRGPVGRDRAYEALNALAVAAGTVLAGCHDPEAEEWFQTAVTQQIAVIGKDRQQ